MLDETAAILLQAADPQGPSEHDDDLPDAYPCSTPAPDDFGPPDSYRRPDDFDGPSRSGDESLYGDERGGQRPKRP